MIPRIRLLNRLLANQIAAGEVIERPASVVKELLENSIDAKAKQIEVSIQQGGFHIIKVRDDGYGIEQEDLRLAVTPHATSKITQVEDLATIGTLGFRGEALASIASVARFWLSSKPKDQAQAWQLHLDGADTDAELQPTAHPSGTTVTVQDLFFNTPARRKFLRSERTEYLQIEEIFKRIALSHLNIGFTLTHNQRMIYRLLPANTETQQQRRVAKIFGSHFMENACYVDIQATGLTLKGWLALPTLSRSQNDLQYVYLNGRLVRDRVINHALRQAFEDLLPEGRNALYLLYLTIEPSMVDVNVHPTKHEVRFHQSRLVHDFIVSAVRRAFQQAKVPVADLERDKSAFHSYLAEPAPIYGMAEEIFTTSKTQENIPNTWGTAIACVKKRWLLSEIEQGMLLIDIYAAQQFICAHLLMQAYANNTIESQTLLFPHTHSLTGSSLIQLLSMREQLKTIGICVDQLAQNTIIIRSLPKLLGEWNSYDFLLALNDRLNQYPKIESSEIIALTSQYIKPQALNTQPQQQAFLGELNVHFPLFLGNIPKFCTLFNL